VLRRGRHPWLAILAGAIKGIIASFNDGRLAGKAFDRGRFSE
jgi:hypothetical protein